MTPAPLDGLVAALMRQPLPAAAVLRLARTALQLNQAELGRRCNTSRSQISRWETGAPPLRDVPTLRRLAEALGLPAHVFGLSPSGAPTPPVPPPSPRVARITDTGREDDSVRRRSFLVAAGLAITTPTA